MLRSFVILLTVIGVGYGQAMVQHAAAAAGGAAAAAGSKKIAEGLEKMLGQAAGAAENAAQTPAPPPPPPVATPATPARRAKPSPFVPKVTRAGGASTVAPVIPQQATTDDVESGTPGNYWVPKTSGSGRAPAAKSPFSPAYYEAGAGSGGGGAYYSGGGGSRNYAQPPAPSMPEAVATIAPPPPPPAPRIIPTVEMLTAVQVGESYQSIVSQLGTPAVKISMLEEGAVLETLRIEARGVRLGTIHMVNGQVQSVELSGVAQ